MFAIYKKEMRGYFTTPLGYVFIAVFLAVSGFMFAVATLQSSTSDVSGYFQLMIFGYIVIVPLLTMRSAELTLEEIFLKITSGSYEPPVPVAAADQVQIEAAVDQAIAEQNGADLPADHNEGGEN